MAGSRCRPIPVLENPASSGVELPPLPPLNLPPPTARATAASARGTGADGISHRAVADAAGRALLRARADLAGRLFPPASLYRTRRPAGVDGRGEHRAGGDGTAAAPAADEGIRRHADRRRPGRTLLRPLCRDGAHAVAAGDKPGGGRPGAAALVALRLRPGAADELAGARAAGAGAGLRDHVLKPGDPLRPGARTCCWPAWRCCSSCGRRG